MSSWIPGRNSWIQRREGPTSFLTLMRPPINALDSMALNELAEVVEKVEADRETRVVVITSGIKGIFCSGGDMNFWRQVRDGREVSRVGREAFARIERLSKPTIAAINGHIVGDGLNLALACDLRIASEATTIRLPEVAYGFIPGWGLIHRLVTLVGRANAHELLLTGQKVEATQARVIGLVNEVVSSDRLMDEVLGQTQKMATFSPGALRAVKCALLGGNEKACFESLWGNADWCEGIDALLAKMMPVFGSDKGGGKGCDFVRCAQKNRPSGEGRSSLLSRFRARTNSSS
jgi:enoyl-CoA hydratase/carnithine racemase